MALGVGIDILKIERIRSTVEDADDPFLIKIFTNREREEALGRDQPYLYYATRFAGKEAVFKSLSLNPNHVDLSEIEILNKENGEPYVNLYGDIAQHASDRGIGKVLISLSYDTEYAIASALATRGEEGKRKEDIGWENG